MAPGFVGGPFGGDAHPVLDLREGLLDWIEIRRVGRQEPEPGSGSIDCAADSLRLVAAKIIHDDDVARLQGGYKLALHISQEAGTVDRSIEDIRGGKPIQAQGPEESHRTPASMRGETA